MTRAKLAGITLAFLLATLAVSIALRAIVRRHQDCVSHQQSAAHIAALCRDGNDHACRYEHLARLDAAFVCEEE